VPAESRLDKEFNPGEREALNRALRFLDYRPRSSGEIRDRMTKWGYGTLVREKVIGYLEDSGLVDDREFARLFMEELVEKQFGFYRVREKLVTKRLSKDVVEEVMEYYPSDKEFERAYELGMSRAARLSGQGDQVVQRKLVGLLQRRGFAGGVAREVVRSLTRVDTELGRD
jgi:regulatory protein